MRYFLSLIFATFCFSSTLVFGATAKFADLYAPQGFQQSPTVELANYNMCEKDDECGAGNKCCSSNVGNRCFREESCESV
jgi:hypothetical protein